LRTAEAAESDETINVTGHYVVGDQLMTMVLHTVVWEFCEPEAFWPPSLAIVNKAEVQNSASTTEDLGNLFFG
jgi:hypothetical protein